MSPYQLIEKFTFNHENLQLIERYHEMTILEIYGKSRSETAHSNFIAWLFRQNNWPCPPQFSPITLFLKSLCRVSRSEGLTINSEIEKLLYTRPELFKVKNVETEVICKGIKKEKGDVKVDIVIRCEILTNPKQHLLLVIENKVRTMDHDDQTWNYYAYFNEFKQHSNDVINKNIEDNGIIINGNSQYKRTENEEQLFIFLAPYKENDKLKVCPYFIHYQYQWLMDDILQNILKYNNLDQRRKDIIKDYVSSLSMPYIDFSEFDPDKKSNVEPAMAIIDSDEALLNSFYENNLPIIDNTINSKDPLLLNFWENNYAILVAVLGALERQASRKEGIEKLKQLKGILDDQAGRSKKDTTKYKVYFSEKVIGTFRKTELPTGIVKFLVNKNYDVKSLIGLNVIDHNNKPAILNTPEYEKLVHQSPSYSEGKRFEPIILNGETILYVSKEWDKECIREFIKWAESQGFEIN